MKKNLALIFFLCILPVAVCSQTFEWARSSGTNVSANAAGIAADEHGNIYLCGNFFGTAHFGKQTLQGQARDIFVAKYNSRGEALWATRAGSGSDDFANAISLDKAGNCYMAGSFTYTVALGHDTLKSGGQSNALIAKYSPSGEVLWARSASGVGQGHATAIAVDKADNVYVSGFFKDTLHFPRGVDLAAHSTTYSIFFAKYDGKGNFLWAKTVAGNNYYVPGDGLAIASQPDGMTYLTGFYQNEAIFDSQKLTNHGSLGLFLAKYDANGKLIWLKSASKDGSQISPRVIALDKSGNAYISGTYTYTALFDTITTISRNLGNPEFFLAKYNPSGRIVWLRSSSSFGTKTSYGIECDKEGNPVVTGLFHDSATFGPATLSGTAKEDFFVVKYDVNGNPLWAKQGGLHGTSSGMAVALDKSGNIFIAGNFTDTADFGKVSLVASENTRDFFLAKISPRLIIKEKRTPGILTPATDLQFVSCIYNPKTKSAQVNFYLGKNAFVSLRVLSEIGETEESYIEGQRIQGMYNDTIDLKSLSPGEYYCRLQAGAEKATKKIQVK